MKKLLILLLTLVLAIPCVLGLTACGKDKSSVIDPKTKTITVGYTDYEPMNYTENGVLKGFDTELAIMTFNALGYKVRFKLIEWDNKYIELNGNSIDCIWNGFTSNGSDEINGVSTPRSESVDFSYDYMKNGQCIVKKSATASINDFSDFEGKSVAFENGSSGDAFINDNDNMSGVGVMPQGKASQMDAITAVNGGSVDYAIVDVLLAEAICGESGYENLVINEGLDMELEFYAVGFKKGSELTAKVNVMFEAFAKTGVLQELAEKYELGDSVVTEFVK